MDKHLHGILSGQLKSSSPLVVNVSWPLLPLSQNFGNRHFLHLSSFFGPLKRYCLYLLTPGINTSWQFLEDDLESTACQMSSVSAVNTFPTHSKTWETLLHPHPTQTPKKTRVCWRRREEGGELIGGMYGWRKNYRLDFCSLTIKPIVNRDKNVGKNMCEPRSLIRRSGKQETFNTCVHKCLLACLCRYECSFLWILCMNVYRYACMYVSTYVCMNVCIKVYNNMCVWTGIYECTSVWYACTYLFLLHVAGLGEQLYT